MTLDVCTTGFDDEGVQVGTLPVCTQRVDVVVDLLEADGGGLLVEDLADHKVYPLVGLGFKVLGELWLEVKPGDLDAAGETPLGHFTVPVAVRCLVIFLLELQCLLFLIVVILLMITSTTSNRRRGGGSGRNGGGR